MNPWMERLWAEMNRLPGPLWVFGTYALFQFSEGIGHLFQIVLTGGGFQDWRFVGMEILVLVSNLLPLWIVVCLLARKDYALSLAWWYAAIKVLCCFMILVQPLLHPDVSFDALLFYSAGVTPVVRGLVWFGFMCYLDRADALRDLYPPERRRVVPWWLGIALLAVLLICG